MHLRFALIAALLLAALSVSLIDMETAMEHRVREVIAKSHWRGTYKKLSDGLYEFTSDEGRTFRQYIGAARTTGGIPPKRIQVLDVRLADTTGFAGRFRKIGLMPIGSDTRFIVGLRAASGNVYLSGTQRTWQGYTGTFVLRAVPNLDSCPVVFRYEDAMAPSAVGRFRGSNTPHLLGDLSAKSFFYDTPDGGEYPTRRVATRDGNGSEETPRLADFDNDGYDEILILSDLSGKDWGVHISRFDTVKSAFVDMYFWTMKDVYFNKGSFAVGDFNRNGWNEFAFSATRGYVYVGEHRSAGTGYVIRLTDTTKFMNTGWNCEGHDVDADGRPECFVGSDAFGGPYNIAVYEAKPDTTYEVSLWLEIRGIGAMSCGMMAGDVDGDGREELAAWFGGVLLILKATADDDYSLFWKKSFPSDIEVTLFDVDGDGAQELFVGQLDFPGMKAGTEAFKFNKLASVSSTANPDGNLRLVSLFPSPAVDVVTGSAVIPPNVDALLALHSIDGRRVHHIAYDRMHYERTVSFTLPCAQLPQGVYFLSLSNINSSVVKKILVAHH